MLKPRKGQDGNLVGKETCPTHQATTDTEVNEGGLAKWEEIVLDIIKHESGRHLGRKTSG